MYLWGYAIDLLFGASVRYRSTDGAHESTRGLFASFRDATAPGNRAALRFGALGAGLRLPTPAASQIENANSQINFKARRPGVVTQTIESAIPARAGRRRLMVKRTNVGGYQDKNVSASVQPGAT